MEYHDKILSMAKYKPVNPTEVAKALRKESYIASAMLSEMVQKGLLKISSLKVGSSPLYYDPAQPEQLMNYASYLNEKDKKTYALLKEKKVLRENALDPLSRVCVKNLKDFARPLEVSFANNKEIFWKWYMLSDADAEPVIRQMLANLAQPQPVQTAPEQVDEPKEPVLPANTYKISASDLADPITLKYKIDPEDEGIIKTATFDIRNFGDSALKPVVIFYVGSTEDSAIKRFEYDEIPPGYKMIVTEDVNMAVFGLHDVNAIKATLSDGNNNEAILGDDNQNYIAKPSYDSS